MSSDQWIVVPNWDEYQHYKKRDPVWIRDYVRQLWHPDWMALTLAQRGLLWTARLAYAHHNGQLRRSDFNDYITPELGETHGETRLKRHRYLKRLNQADFLDLVASRPLSLSLKAFKTSTRAGEQEEHPPCPFCEVGAGRHTSDCPTLDHPELLVHHLLEGSTHA